MFEISFKVVNLASHPAAAFLGIVNMIGLSAVRAHRRL